MTGVAPPFPGLLGLPRDYLNAQLGAWRSGQRRAHAPDCMAQVAARLSPEDIGAVSSWLAAQPVPAQRGRRRPRRSRCRCRAAASPAAGRRRERRRRDEGASRPSIATRRRRGARCCSPRRSSPG